MGYRLKYHNLKIKKYTQTPNGKKYTQTPNGKKLKNKWAIAEGNMLVSAVSGLTLAQAKKQLPYYQKCKVFVFTG